MKLKEFSKLPHIIFTCDELSPKAKVMMAYLTNKSNYFNSEEDWFGIPLILFSQEIGFTDHHTVSECREELIKHGLIQYKRGGKGKASLYKINWESIYNNLSKRVNNNKIQKQTDDMGNYIGTLDEIKTKKHNEKNIDDENIELPINDSDEDNEYYEKMYEAIINKNREQLAF